MSASKGGRRRGGAPVRPGVSRHKGSGTATFLLPPTVTRETLLERGSDRRFRSLVNDLLTIATRMEVVREHLGRRMGISGPQYSVLVAIAQYAVLVVGLVMVLIGVFVMIANSHVT